MTQTRRVVVMQCLRAVGHICIMGAEEQGTFFELQNWYHHVMVK